MAKRDNNDIFQRLRKAGLRKPAARALSELGDGASKRAVRAARAVVTELRSLVDELEQRLPGARSGAAPVASTKRRTATSAPPATTARRTRAPQAASRTKRASAPSRAADAPAKRTTTAKTPRGENKAKILAALSSGPKTASQVAAETGIKTGTASTTLTKMLAAGEVIKAARGYALPQEQHAATARRSSASS
jgi:hypothetical protein